MQSLQSDAVQSKRKLEEIQSSFNSSQGNKRHTSYQSDQNKLVIQKPPRQQQDGMSTSQLLSSTHLNRQLHQSTTNKPLTSSATSIDDKLSSAKKEWEKTFQTEMKRKEDKDRRHAVKQRNITRQLELQREYTVQFCQKLQIIMRNVMKHLQLIRKLPPTSDDDETTCSQSHKNDDTKDILSRLRTLLVS